MAGPEVVPEVVPLSGPSAVSFLIESLFPVLLLGECLRAEKIEVKKLIVILPDFNSAKNIANRSQ